MGASDLRTDEWEALVFAPFCVYFAVASADGPPEVSQFRRLVDELDAARTRFTGAGISATAIRTLHDDLDRMWDAYHARRVEPRRGLERARGILGRVTEGERRAYATWLVDLAVAISGSRHTAGEAATSEREHRAIRDVASWLRMPAPTVD